MGNMSADERIKRIGDAIEAAELSRTERLLKQYIGTIFPASLGMPRALIEIQGSAQLSLMAEIRFRTVVPEAAGKMRETERQLIDVAKSIDLLRAPDFKLDTQDGWGVFEELFIDDPEIFPGAQVSDVCTKLLLLRKDIQIALRILGSVKLKPEPADIFVRHFIGGMSGFWNEFGGPPIGANRSSFVHLVATAIDDFGLRDLLGPTTPGDDWLDRRVKSKIEFLESRDEF